MGASFLGVAVTLLGLLAAKLQDHMHLRDLRLFGAAILFLLASIVAAVWTQLRANWSANAILMATAEAHDNQLNYERSMAFNRSTALRSNDQTKPSNDEVPKAKYRWDNGLVLRLQAASVALLRLIDAALCDFCDLQPSCPISVCTSVNLHNPPRHATASLCAAVFAAAHPRFAAGAEDRPRTGGT